MREGEVLNQIQEYDPLYHAVLYGERVSCAKFSKRLSCAIKHLPLRLHFSFKYDTLKAVEKGITKDPTLMLNGEIFLEGLVQAELITEAFEKLFESKKAK